MDLIKKAKNLGCVIKNDDYYLWEIQKWLREEHKIDIRVDGDSIGTGDYRSAVKKDGEFKGRWSNASRLVIKYEVALEKALVKALKLI